MKTDPETPGRTAEPMPLPSPGARPIRRWWILAVVALAQLMVLLDVSIVNIALPSAQRALGFADDERQWIVTAYALTFGSLLLLGGRAGDLFGRKWALIAGMTGFALASAAGGAAPDFAVLVTARALQGAFGAILSPAALSTLANAFAGERDRGRAFGVYGAVTAGGGAVGLLLGGVLTEYATWRWCFYVNLFIAAAAAVGVLTVIRSDPRPRRPGLDVTGSPAAAIALFCIVYGFSRAETSGWSDSITIGSLCLGAGLLAAFAFIEQRVAAPLLPLRILRSRNRAGSYAALGLTAICIFGVFLFLTYYLQLVKGYSPLATGAAFLPMVGAVVAGSMAANASLLPVLGPRLLVGPGMLIAAGGMFYLSQITPSAGYAGQLLPPMLLIGLGAGLAIAPAINTATAGVAPNDAGAASAMANAMQQIGGSVGTALLSTIAASAAGSPAAAYPGPGAQAAAAVHGYTAAFTFAGCILASGAVVVSALLHGRPTGGPALEGRSAGPDETAS
jgi:EmrB/QacA subfamily drug resistance transporter